MTPGNKSVGIITPSYAPDLELCADLNASVMRYCDDAVVHHIVVPSRDMTKFLPLANPRTRIHSVDEFLPRSLRQIPGMNLWLNIRHPLPPVRGWIAQQIVKLSAAASIKTDIALLVDSDVALIRPVSSLIYAPDGELELFRVTDGVDDSLPRHRLWHDAARRLLGLPATHAHLLPDYICCPCPWSPLIVRAMFARIEQVTGLHWATAVGKELHFSEMILYGVYVEEILAKTRCTPVSANMHCLNSYDEVALSKRDFQQLLSSGRATDVAVMVSAKSGTPLDVRREALQEFAAGERSI